MDFGNTSVTKYLDTENIEKRLSSIFYKK